MKSLNKKLYSVIIVCLLVLCFSLSVFATESSTPTTPDLGSSQASVTTSTPSVDGTSSSEGTSSNGAGDGLSDASNTSGEGTESGDLNSTGSDLSGSSDLASVEQTASYESNTAVTSTGKTSSKKPTYHGNIGGYVDDEADTSGWGTDDSSSELVSAGTTEKKENKKITDYSGLLWILIWIPILLILGSVGALVYVNRKAFFEAEESYSDSDDANKPPKRRKLSAAEKAKRKNNHKNRTNVYKPRD